MAKHEPFCEAPQGGSGDLQLSHDARPSIVLKVPADPGRVRGATLGPVGCV
jgi:hypothetical protein